MTDSKQGNIPQWGQFEKSFTSAKSYANPFLDAGMTITFTSPSGKEWQVDGFWDGGTLWRVRFSPNERGTWTYVTHCSDKDNHGLEGQRGTLTCAASSGSNRFEQHGPIQVSANRRYLTHADGTPFLWLGDTAWNGHLLSTPDEWAHYLRERVRQKFTAVQWVVTHWLASPNGDMNNQKPFEGIEKIALNPSFFQRLDHYVEKTYRAGLLLVPVMLWAAEWRDTEHNPGFYLPEDQATRLGRYMVARWGAYPVAWILPGDSDYRGAKAERWKRIGQGIFGDTVHAPVSLHPAGMHWNGDDFRNEAWLDILGYQSGHGDDDETLAWLVCGPPATDWQTEPPRTFINLEPPYEDHIAYQSKERITADNTRRALYWSLLVSPPAGVTYGGHGVWGWDDGTSPPVAHPNTGIPKPWQQALLLPGAEQIRYLSDLFESIQWWRLVPTPELLAAQPGEQDHSLFITAAKSTENDLIVVYTPRAREFTLNMNGLPDDLSAMWFDPRSGARQSATLDAGHFITPAEGDWVLVLGRTISLPAV
ncbi:MAG: DUF4038 domain-containing protein [Anaerolineaceae bacterium]|nr:DUF4038 domain-containing protein [Anaerolineaceae bacterium]